MSDIPAARELLAVLAPALVPEHQAVVQKALSLMHRRPYAKPRAPVRSAPVGPLVAEAIRRYARRYPRMSEMAIAAVFRTNPGRVSEALHFDR